MTATDLLRALTPPLGVELRAIPCLGGPPRFEPERFSGGVNISAQERNQKRRKEAYRLYSLSDMPGVVFGAPWLIEEIRKAAAR